MIISILFLQNIISLGTPSELKDEFEFSDLFLSQNSIFLLLVRLLHLHCEVQLEILVVYLIAIGLGTGIMILLFV